jgi:hypothetical protein
MHRGCLLGVAASLQARLYLEDERLEIVERCCRALVSHMRSGAARWGLESFGLRDGSLWQGSCALRAGPCKVERRKTSPLGDRAIGRDVRFPIQSKRKMKIKMLEGD